MLFSNVSKTSLGADHVGNNSKVAALALHSRLVSNTDRQSAWSSCSLFRTVIDCFSESFDRLEMNSSRAKDLFFDLCEAGFFFELEASLEVSASAGGADLFLEHCKGTDLLPFAGISLD